MMSRTRNEEVTLAEAQDILTSLEESVSRPVVDIHDLMEGWGSTTNEPLSAMSIEAQSGVSVPDSDTDTILDTSSARKNEMTDQISLCFCESCRSKYRE